MKVLIADEDPVVRQLLETVARGTGYDVISVVSGPAAIEVLARHPFDLVILDWQMPGLNGLEVCLKLREMPNNEHAFVIMLTSRDSTADLLGALESGVDDYITKPVSPDRLTARLVVAERRIHQNAQRRRAEDALAHATYIAGIGQMTLALQHEINNPLAAVLAHAELLLTTLPPEDTESRGEVRVIIEESKRIAAVIRRLSTLEKPRTVDYLDGTKMIDLSSGRDGTPEGGT